MMKNLLVLMLVLCVVSLASAGVTLTGLDEISVDGGTITVTIVGTAVEHSGSVFIDYAAYGYYGTYVSSGVYVAGPWTMDSMSLSSPSGLPAGGGWFINNAYAGLEFVGAGQYGSTPIAVTAGNWLQFDLTLASGQSTYAVDDTVDLSVHGIGYIIPESGGYTITIVPEPMTMALLGLGGLFLRRRK